MMSDTVSFLSLPMIFLTSLFVCLVLIVAHKRNILRHSRKHDQRAVQASHVVPASRLGGVGVFLAVFAATFLLKINSDFDTPFLVALSCVPVFLAGLAEDMGFDVSPLRRLMAAAVSSVFAILLLGIWLPRTDLPGVDGLMLYAPFAIFLTVLAASGYCHAVNLIDGMHGLAASTAILTAVGLAVVAAQAGLPEISDLAAILAAAAFGFLVLNWPLGKIFLGDSGSYSVGHILVWLGFLLVVRDPSVSVFAVVLVMFWPFADTLFTIQRRLRVGRAISRPDRLHHHQVVRRGLELIWLGRGNRHISNPVATLVMLPLIAAPVIAGVVLWDRPLAAAVALLLFAALFVATYLVAIRYLQTLNHSKPKQPPLRPVRAAVAYPNSLISAEVFILGEVISSHYSGPFNIGERSLDVRIFKKSGKSAWNLEMVEAGRTTVEWRRKFVSESEAWSAFINHVEAAVPDRQLGLNQH